MAKVVFTPNIQRHVACPEAEAAGRTVREVLDNVFAENAQARGYVLDDQSALRKHMTIFRRRADDPRPRAPRRSGDRDQHDPCVPGAVRRLMMSDKLARFDPQGPVHGGAQAQRHGRSRQSISWATTSSLTLTDPPRRATLCGARPRPFRRQAAPLDGERLGGDRGAGLSAEARRLRRERHVGPAARLEHGPHLGAGSRAAPTSPACSGAARCPAACSARATTARAGRSCARCGTIPSASNGWAAAPTCPASIRSASTRAIRSACRIGGLDRRRLAHRGRAAQPGRCAARACAPNTCRRSRRTIPIAQDVHCLVQCPAAPRAHVGAAPQRHLRLLRRGPDASREITGVEPSTFGFAVAVHPQRSRHRLVRARDQGREAHPARRQARGHAHARRRQDLRDR